MLQHIFHDEKEHDEQQEYDQHAIAALVMLPVEVFVLAVNENRGNDENDDEYCGEN